MTPPNPFLALDLVAALPPRTQARLAPHARGFDIAAGDTCDALGQDGLVLFVLAGRLRVSACTDGRIAYVDLAGGAAAGLVEAVMGRSCGPRAVLALEDSHIVVLPAAPLLAAVAASAAASFALARRLAGALAAAEGSDDPLQRVFRDLLRATRPLGEARWTVDPLPRHRELAERAGVAEEAAAAAVAHLVRLGVARRRYPALDIEDREALRALAG
jgi:CRP-like cAMP-binding protein